MARIRKYFVLTHEARHLILKILGPPLALIFHLFGCLATAVLGNHVEHVVAESSALLFYPTALHFPRKNSHGFSR